MNQSQLTQLQNLPNELLILILKHISHEDLRAVRLTSKQMCRLADYVEYQRNKPKVEAILSLAQADAPGLVTRAHAEAMVKIHQDKKLSYKAFMREYFSKKSHRGSLTPAELAGISLACLKGIRLLKEPRFIPSFGGVSAYEFSRFVEVEFPRTILQKKQEMNTIFWLRLKFSPLPMILMGITISAIFHLDPITSYFPVGVIFVLSLIGLFFWQHHFLASEAERGFDLDAIPLAETLRVHTRYSSLEKEYIAWVRSVLINMDQDFLNLRDPVGARELMKDYHRIALLNTLSYVPYYLSGLYNILAFSFNNVPLLLLLYQISIFERRRPYAYIFSLLEWSVYITTFTLMFRNEELDDFMREHVYMNHSFFKALSAGVTGGVAVGATVVAEEVLLNLPRVIHAAIENSSEMIERTANTLQSGVATIRSWCPFWTRSRRSEDIDLEAGYSEDEVPLLEI
jgi:hypothetical protein